MFGVLETQMCFYRCLFDLNKQAITNATILDNSHISQSYMLQYWGLWDPKYKGGTVNINRP